MAPLNICHNSGVDNISYIVSSSVPSCPFQIPLHNLVVQPAASATSNIIFL